MNKLVGLYIRVSTEHQAKEGYSIEAQKANLTNFAHNQGWQIVDTYIDAGISGKNITNRPQVKRLINDIKQSKLDIILLYKFDRLTRDAKDTESIIELVEKWGIEVYTLSGGIVDVSTASGRFSVRISGAVAQLEREQTIERVKVALKQKANMGYTLASSRMCYGYNREYHQKEQTINNIEAINVKRIYSLFLNGKTPPEIARLFNLENVPTKLSNRYLHTMWTSKTIYLILTNPTYIGKIRYHIGQEDECILDGIHEPIIEETIWNNVQDKIQKLKCHHKTNKPKEDIYFCGFLICGVCGRKLTTNRTVRTNAHGQKITYNAYRCPNHEKKLCSLKGISHNKIELIFSNYLNNYASIIKPHKLNVNNAQIENKDYHQKLNKKLQELMRLFVLNKITYEELTYMKKELLKHQKVIADDLKIAPKSTPKEISIKEEWQLLTNREKSNFLNNFIESITINNCNTLPEILDIKFYATKKGE